MRINSNSPSSARGRGRSQSADSSGGSAASGGARSDSGGGAARVDLNAPSLQAKLEDLPEVRTDRVEDLKTAINRGEYQVDGEEVVGSVLRNVLLENIT
jgi:flagellar biosynthesis anti-sigma factor FlgM